MASNPYAGYYGSQDDSLQGYYPMQEQYLQQTPQNMNTQSAGGQGSGGGQGAGGGLFGLGGLFQLGTGIYDLVKGGKDSKKFRAMAEAALNARPVYQTSPYAKAELAQAQAQQNATNPAIIAMMNRAQQGAANVAAAGQRNATTGAEAINAAIAGNAQAQSMYPQIAQAQAAYNQQKQNDLIAAMRGMTGEYQNEFNDSVERNALMRNYRFGQLQAARKQNADGRLGIVGGLNGIASNFKDAFKMMG